jgi:hypothetical protein
MISIVRADPIHVYWINLRTRDSESFIAFGQPPLPKIIEYIKTTLAWTALVDGEVACIWGVQEETPVTGAKVWLVASEIIEKRATRFLIEARKFIKEALKSYKFLYCYVDASFEKSARWLEWMGFEIVSRTKIDNILVYRYELRAQ